MPALKTYDVFISHAWKYDDDYCRVVDFLAGANYFTWRNYSVPVHDPVDPKDSKSKGKLEEALRRQMRPVNVVLIVSGMYTAYSDWIQFEIDYSVLLGKPIIGIRPWGAEKTPKAVSDVAREMVGWQEKSIIDAIRKYAI